jgi:hypothetical protein
MQYFGFGDKIEKTESGSLLVHFDGVMILDSGYEIVVDVTSAPTDDPDNSYHMMRRSLFPV